MFELRLLEAENVNTNEGESGETFGISQTKYPS